MAKHKAPTQVTIASIQQQSVFNELVERYWKPAAGVAIVVSIAILIPTYTRGKAKVAHHDLWDDFGTQAQLGTGLSPVQGGQVETLALFADQHKDSPVGGWAKALEVGEQIEAEKLDEAERSAQQLATVWPEHVLVKSKLYAGPDGSAHSLADAIRTQKATLAAWEKEHAFLFSNPELPADAPRVRLQTSQGPIVVGLYVDRTPAHAANFLELVRSGAYTGTRFHRVVRGSLIQGGDPNTVSGEPETWGLGGPEKKLEPENDPQLRHFKGSLVAWRPDGETQSHGSQFFLTTADQFQMDGKSVVFGRVLEGQETIDAIEAGAVVEDRPQDPAVIESAEILQ